ncbi:hypothetical protein GQ600_11024 [Phytophthora cactorum]|nr:hypothetical protein GQ600_11024 [Phytophthora cactorum]
MPISLYDSPWPRFSDQPQEVHKPEHAKQGTWSTLGHRRRYCINSGRKARQGKLPRQQSHLCWTRHENGPEQAPRCISTRGDVFSTCACLLPTCPRDLNHCFAIRRLSTGFSSGYRLVLNVETFGADFAKFQRFFGRRTTLSLKT